MNQEQIMEQLSFLEPIKYPIIQPDVKVGGNIISCNNHCKYTHEWEPGSCGWKEPRPQDYAPSKVVTGTFGNLVVDQQLVHELIFYNPLTGDTIWKPRDSKFYKSERALNGFNINNAGKSAISLDVKKEYENIHIFNLNLRLHTIVYLYMTGCYPRLIDHRDENKANNSWNNLFISDHHGNARAAGLNANAGAYYREERGKWFKTLTVPQECTEVLKKYAEGRDFPGGYTGRINEQARSMQISAKDKEDCEYQFDFIQNEINFGVNESGLFAP